MIFSDFSDATLSHAADLGGLKKLLHVCIWKHLDDLIIKKFHIALERRKEKDSAKNPRTSLLFGFLQRLCTKNSHSNIDKIL